MSTIFDIADVVELKAWANDQPYSLSTLKDDLETVLPGEESDDAENRANEIFEELERRARLLDNSYPFAVDGNTIVPNELKQNSSYLFCLGLKFFGNITLNLRATEFETIVKVAAENYFCGEAVRIGAPWKTGEIVDYRQLLQLVSNLIPDIGAPVRNAAPGAGDGGWDVVVVKNFQDRKFARIIALGNCATGKNDWHRKGRETGPEYFWDFFTRPPYGRNPCFTFLAIPFIMTDDQRKRKQGRDCIAFDRLRICALAPTTSDAVMLWLDGNRANALDIALI